MGMVKETRYHGRSRENARLADTSLVAIQQSGEHERATLVAADTRCAPTARALRFGLEEGPHLCRAARSGQATITNGGYW
jgi:hypothetical protein